MNGLIRRGTEVQRREVMTEKHIAPYGSWKSPITSDVIVAETIKLEQIVLDGEDIYWVEMRPSEGGRYVIVRRTPDGRTTDMTPPPFNVRTRVHEYGGGAFTVVDGTIYFSNFTDQRLYRQVKGAEPKPITPEKDLRYADGIFDQQRNRMIYVCEDHTNSGDEPLNTLISIDLTRDHEMKVLVSGNDFYSSPCLSPDGTRLAWLTWNHPNMPWDGTELWVARLQEDGSPDPTERVAGGATESVFQPQWSPDNVLYFVSDRVGWWNLYRWLNGNIEPLCEMEAEFGRPQWIFRMSTYAFESADRIVCSYNERGTWRLARLEISTRQIEPFDMLYTSIENVQATPRCAVFTAGSPNEVTSIVQLDLNTGGSEVLRRSTTLTIEAGYLSSPQTIEFPTEHGLIAYAFFYLPQNQDYVAPSEEKPPLLVLSHGGPTSATSPTLNFMIQYWTSRGFAVLDVNYGGSTGYGRAYRERLNGQWGVVDVNDCVNAARYLVELGKVDEERLAIRGGSAGGYTTLCALTFRDVFRAGASYYGVSDAETLAKDTHKFESHYLDTLFGPYPEQRVVYKKRSPIHFVDRLSCPVIFFQGLEDKIVPPDQSETMFKSLRARGVPVAYVTYEGEQHGFRRAENIKHALDAELYFYSKIFGFELADPVEPVHIENL